MTIALGMLATDGIVFAADTQVTAPDFLKIDSGKVQITLCPVDDIMVRHAQGALYRSFGIAGSGNAAYLPDLYQKFGGVFSDLRGMNELQDPHARIQDALREFYDLHILPFSSYPSGERPDIWLVMGAQVGRLRKLWYTEKNLLIKGFQYVAVGAGATYARVLLQRLYSELDSTHAAILAAFIIFQVKENVDGCGHDTDIFVLRRDSPMMVERYAVRELEETFRKYLRIESAFLRSAITDSKGATFKDASLRSIRSVFSEFAIELERANPRWTTDDQSPPQPSPESHGENGES